MRVFLSVLALTAFVACAQSNFKPEPSKVLGAVRVEFKIGQAGVTSSVKPNPPSTRSLNDLGSGAIQMQLVNTSTFTTGARGAGGERWVSATYNIRNAQISSPNTAYAIPNSNVSFIATGSPSTVGESGIADMQTYGGTSLTDVALAQAFKPTHAMRYNVVNNAAETNPGAEDFQAFDESEIFGFTTGGLIPLTYGFVVRRTDAAPSDRTLPASPAVGQFDGRVTFAMRFPLQASASADPFAFAMNFLVVTDDQTRVTQSREQQSANTIPAQTSQLTGAVLNVFSGSFYGGSVRALPNVRIAKASNNSPVYLVQTPSGITVTSSNDSGVGTLRQALADIAPGGTIDLNGLSSSITLLSTLTINKNIGITSTGARVNISGGTTAFTSGNVRIFDVQSNVSLTLDNLTLSNGYATGAPARGAAILNAGTLRVSNVNFTNNQAQGNVGGIGGTGAMAQGGAIYSAGTLIIDSSSFFTGNKAIAGKGGNGAMGTTSPSLPGGPGGNGGSAEGGAVYYTGSALTLSDTIWINNVASGGNGGDGGIGILFGHGGDGGNANSGAVFNAVGTPTATSLSFGTAATKNLVTAGLGGSGMFASNPGTAINDDKNF